MTDYLLFSFHQVSLLSTALKGKLQEAFKLIVGVEAYPFLAYSKVGESKLSAETRLSLAPSNRLIRHMPELDKVVKALEFLRENLSESLINATRIYSISKLNTRRERKKQESEVALVYGGYNRILSEAQERAVIRYIIDYATSRGKGATKQIVYNCILYLRGEEVKPELSKR
ncbi:uncharacterized protein RSE6_05066 [Rhynchosporium secalis]|uniref:Uncharacterized protein n=1 Tax=Rhynchosporium secalis TaxID=38038 RepID=A0A1E1M6U9_RHYSE|nr:uncharacterized protein RSE6_05066 [Rhynchosporium secalis]